MEQQLGSEKQPDFQCFVVAYQPLETGTKVLARDVVVKK